MTRDYTLVSKAVQFQISYTSFVPTTRFEMKIQV